MQAEASASAGPAEPAAPKPRRTIILLGLSSLCAVGVLLLSSLAICVLPLAGAVLAVLVVLARKSRAVSSTPWACRFALFAGALILLFVNLGLGLNSFGILRARGLSEVSAGNLSVIGAALEMYQREHDAFPPSFDELVQTELCPRGCLRAFGDVKAWEVGGRSGPPCYSSFVYQRGAGDWRKDDRLILAYERGPFAWGETKMFPQAGRWVLFASGEVRWLTEHQCELALQQDRAQRKEIGWPTDPVP
jgi:hypothetical protein